MRRGIGWAMMLGAFGCPDASAPPASATSSSGPSSSGTTSSGSTAVSATQSPGADSTSASSSDTAPAPDSDSDSESDSDSSGTTTGEASALQHFGFIGISCDVDDPHDESDITDYVDEVAGFTNLAHLCPLTLDIQPQLDAIAQSGSRALVDLTLVLFEFEPGTPPSGNPERLTLRANANEMWASFVETNPNLDAEHVGAMYLVDEPIWNGVEPEALQSAATLVNTDFPDIPIVVIEAFPVVADAVFPDGVDWVGFDRYVVPDPSTDANYLADLATVQRLKQPDQSIALILDAQWFPFYDKVGLDAADMGQVALHYLELAQSQPDVVALIGYTWVGGIDTPEQLGARSLPSNVLETYVEIGQQIIDG